MKKGVRFCFIQQMKSRLLKITFVRAFKIISMQVKPLINGGHLVTAHVATSEKVKISKIKI